MFGDLMLIRPTFFSESLIDLANSFFDRTDAYEEGPSFIENEDGGYDMNINVGEAKLSDMSVNIEEEKYLKVDYFYQNENSTKSYSLKEFLPFDADSSTVSAKLNNGVLTVHVNKK